MSSVGVFDKVEMDEKSYLVYTLTQTKHPTSSAVESSGDDLPLQPLFSCPYARIRSHKFKVEKNYDGVNFFNFHPFNSYPHFPRTRTSYQQGESLLDYDHHNICKFPVVPLFWCNNKTPDSNEFECGGCEESKTSRSYYACLECGNKFHKQCVESPLEIKHPSHPFHSLRLYSHPTHMVCICCGRLVSNMFYHCVTCDLSMDPICAMEPIPFVVDHPKSHPHPITFFPTQATLACNICGLVKMLDPTYICIQCVFVIHKDCMGYPHVIRISRHQHRISFASSLPYGNLSCGVCHQRVDNNYGAYSCGKCDAYFVHSKCAFHRNVWDGKELEGVSEEDDIIDDGEPFERISDGVILHPYHSHHLRLEISKVYDENKYCRGCSFPIYEGQFYSCMECDFILHESCANAPRMKRHPLHPHPLTLNVATKELGNNEGVYHCNVCGRDGTGFFYEHHIGERRFRLDLRCASIREPFEYQCHKHPLCIASELEKKVRCQICKGKSYSKLNCMECDYIICFRCATFPYKVRYKHDSHFLRIRDGKKASDEPDWCEVCEGKIEEVKERESPWDKRREMRFYKCNDCCTTLHVECLLGRDMYMKPGNSVKDYISKHSLGIEGTQWTDVRVFLNSSLSRPICTGCMRRCLFPIVFKGYNTIFCSWECIGYGDTVFEHPTSNPFSSIVELELM
ncbi:CHP-rich zinc finger protein-like [Arabidopsis thaliana]|uniref:CHP-rich zinc finger protein-like n=1 Tax=Arabidopsis thaliana TaxID=3702 RepID=Q9LRV1_ARATH|nr:Cysteine/Histidine-rich C1 domain family protein [Arabidopsis thaliana]AEE77177.1 Cysteine/Histidine-rich C1 domain family protein [Arabidopsis thaliana]BAB01837.1 CHP-rich zinc finger protein-like [Arabidopsis thaliana]|eukprot:NP_189287.1 Cysteine/Histidine-rich C1 domain family protein [Arabidopsis thaliana]